MPVMAVTCCRDSDSDYSLIRVHKHRLARDTGPGPAPTCLKPNRTQGVGYLDSRGSGPAGLGFGLASLGSLRPTRRTARHVLGWACAWLGDSEQSSIAHCSPCRRVIRLPSAARTPAPAHRPRTPSLRGTVLVLVP
jgi:hypothetical protein